jgi:hypothetical protein
MKTKSTIKIVLFLISVGLITSCQNGNKGNSYFQILNASGNAYNFNFSDPSVPSTFYYNNYYLTKEGVYSYSYDYGSLTYSGNYTIFENDGVAWDGFSNGLLTRGADGADRHFTFDCDQSSGNELSTFRIRPGHRMDTVRVDKIIYVKGGMIHIKGMGVYNSNLLEEVKKIK